MGISMGDLGWYDRRKHPYVGTETRIRWSMWITTVSAGFGVKEDRDSINTRVSV